MNNILNLLAEKTQDPTYYLKSLNYIEEVDLEIYRSLINSLSNSEVQVLIEDDNWRSQLVAYMVVLLGQKIEFLELLKNGLLKGSFVSPQIVVAIVMLGKKQVAEFLQEIIVSKSCNSKVHGAIFAVLPYCLINNITPSEIEFDLSEFGIGFNAAQQHIRFWKKIERVGLP